MDLHNYETAVNIEEVDAAFDFHLMMPLNFKSSSSQSPYDDCLSPGLT